MARITLRLPDELDDDIEEYLGYNDTKSEFYRQAAREKLDRLTSKDDYSFDPEVNDLSEVDA